MYFCIIVYNYTLGVNAILKSSFDFLCHLHIFRFQTIISFFPSFLNRVFFSYEICTFVRYHVTALSCKIFVFSCIILSFHHAITFPVTPKSACSAANAFCMLSIFYTYSFLIAAKGLSFMARKEGKNPETIPMIIAKIIAMPGSHIGMEKSFPEP